MGTEPNNESESSEERISETPNTNDGSLVKINGLLFFTLTQDMDKFSSFAEDVTLARF